MTGGFAIARGAAVTEQEIAALAAALAVLAAKAASAASAASAARAANAANAARAASGAGKAQVGQWPAAPGRQLRLRMAKTRRISRYKNTMSTTSPNAQVQAILAGAPF